MHFFIWVMIELCALNESYLFKFIKKAEDIIWNIYGGYFVI
jgi:hypothetical protein